MTIGGNQQCRFEDTDEIGDNVQMEKNQQQLLEHITKKDHISLIEHTLKKGAFVNKQDRYGSLPLQRAIDVNYDDCITFLISKGADLNAVDDYGFTPILLAASRGNSKAMTSLMNSGAIFDYCDGRGVPENLRQLGYLTYDPLNIAIENNFFCCVKLLLERGANPNKKYYMGFEINLAPVNNLMCLELLLKFGANPNLLSRYGMTPLMRACKENRAGAVQLLINNGADVNLQCRSSFRWSSPINCAIEHGAIDIVKILLKNGANTWREIGCKYSPLHEAVFAEMPDICNLLLDNNAEVDELSDDGYSPLRLAVNIHDLYKRETIVNILLKNKSDLNLLTPNSQNSILVEYLKNTQTKPCVNIVLLLLRYGAEVNLRTLNSHGQHDPFGVLHLLSRICDSDLFYLVCNASKQVDLNSVLNSTHGRCLKEGQLEYVRSPRPLQVLVRLCVRENMNGKESIEAFKLPSILKKYLCYE